MNLTISVDDDTLDRARALARQRGMSLQELLRQMLDALVGSKGPAETADELMRLFRESPGDSNGRPFHRGDAYADRV